MHCLFHKALLCSALAVSSTVALLFLELPCHSSLYGHAYIIPTILKPRPNTARILPRLSFSSSIEPNEVKSKNLTNANAEEVNFSNEDKNEENQLPSISPGKAELIPLKLPGAKETEKKRKLVLSWCDREACIPYQIVREKVDGANNEIGFSSPATGQVVYNWESSDDVGIDLPVALPSVLLLVRNNDDELMKEAANVVHKLIAKGGIKVMLRPEVAAKLKHYFGVDDDKIELYDLKPIPGFGGNHLPTNDHQYNAHSFETKLEDEKIIDDSDSPDLVCTLGGDGLLMHASTLFPGPCPPILCVAGGSLGFLTPFSRDEMVNAIQVSLGLIRGEEYYYNGQGEDTVWQPPPDSDTKSPNNERGENIVMSKPQDETEFKLWANNQICMSLRMRLECQVTNKEGTVRARFNVLNEVVIDRGSSPYLAALECFCDDVHLTTVQADGVIFSTPTGSTAYSMAAGGSVVHPAVPAILVTPICPHVLSFRSMVFPDHVVLRCFVPEDARADAAVAFDGKYRRVLHRGDSVQVKMSSYPVPTINRIDHTADWLTSLKRNFNFNTRARQKPL